MRVYIPPDGIPRTDDMRGAVVGMCATCDDDRSRWYKNAIWKD